MHSIVEIVSVEGWTNDGKSHIITWALLDNGEEARGYSDNYKPGDSVMCWYSEEFGCYQMKKPEK